MKPLLYLDSAQHWIDGDTPRDVRGAPKLLRSKIGDLEIAMVTITDGHYMSASRPLRTQQFDDDGVLWFFVSSEGSVAACLESNQRVNVSYIDPARGIFLSLSGYAHLVFDPDRILALWDDGVLSWFSDGPPDPKLALLRVDVLDAQYWDEHLSLVRRVTLRALATLIGRPSFSRLDHQHLTLRHEESVASSQRSLTKNSRKLVGTVSRN